MAWETTEWACGHTGAMQLYGKTSGREATIARESGRKCMACWLVERWDGEDDPRSQREDRYALAAKIAEGKGKRICVPDSVPVTTRDKDNPLAGFATADLLAEIARRQETGEQ